MKAQREVDKIIINLEGRINNQPVGTLFNDEYYNHSTEKLDESLVYNERGTYA